MTNTVHSVGTLSIANPGHQCPVSPVTDRPKLSLPGVPPKDNPRCLAGQGAPAALNGLSLLQVNQRRGFKLMKSARIRASLSMSWRSADGGEGRFGEKSHQ